MTGYRSDLDHLELIEQLRSVGGWLVDDDAHLFLAADRVTRAVGTGHGMTEIGVYLGRSAILLGALLDPDEDLFVVDPFGRASPDAEVHAEQVRHYRDLDREAFEANFARFHDWLPTTVQGFSTDLVAADLPAGNRMMHIDGAHDHRSVLHDVELTIAALDPLGIAVFDDTSNRENPGVMAAVWGAVAREELRLLASTLKAWVCLPDAYDELMPRFRAVVAADRAVTTFEVELFGHAALVAKSTKPPLPSRPRRVARSLVPPIVDQVRRRLRR